MIRCATRGPEGQRWLLFPINLIKKWYKRKENNDAKQGGSAHFMADLIFEKQSPGGFCSALVNPAPARGVCASVEFDNRFFWFYC
jgi:hypothetical protein